MRAKIVFILGLLAASAVAIGDLHNHRHDYHFLETSEQTHKREALDLLKSAEKEMGEGYDIAAYSKNPDEGVGPDARVIQYLKDTGADPDALSEGWCNPFVQFQLKENGYEYSEYNAESIIMNVLTKTQDPVPGDIVMELGHIALISGFHKAWDGTLMVDYIGGAQSGRVCVLSEPANRAEFYARPIKAPKGWQPMLHPFWQKIENDGITVKRPTPTFAYPTPYPVQ
jgi:hypothetical protein